MTEPRGFVPVIVRISQLCVSFIRISQHGIRASQHGVLVPIYSTGLKQGLIIPVIGRRLSEDFHERGERDQTGLYQEGILISQLFFSGSAMISQLCVWTGQHGVFVRRLWEDFYERGGRDRPPTGSMALLRLFYYSRA